MKHKPDVFCSVGIIFMAVGAPFTGTGIWISVNADSLRGSPNTTGDPALLGLIFLLVGVVQFAIGVFLALGWFLRVKGQDRAVAEGRTFSGHVIGLCEDWSQMVNGRPLWYLTAEAEIDGRMERFEGSRIRNGSGLPDVGSEVRIHIDERTNAYAITDMWGNML